MPPTDSNMNNVTQIMLILATKSHIQNMRAAIVAPRSAINPSILNKCNSN